VRVNIQRNEAQPGEAAKLLLDLGQPAPLREDHELMPQRGKVPGDLNHAALHTTDHTIVLAEVHHDLHRDPRRVKRILEAREQFVDVGDRDTR
jgi:hypothetical protein